MNTKTAFLPTPNGRISKWLDENFGIKTITNYDSADLVVFPGGLDVDPNLYNEPAGQRTSFSAKVDQEWQSYYKNAVKNGKKILGICKGSQFVTAMSGGSLYQHVENHAISGMHDINISGERFSVTSTHHQMMNPFVLGKEDYDLLAFSEERRSEFYLNGYDDEMEMPIKEPEAVFYKGNGALAIQFHPEFMDNGDPVQKIIGEWIDTMLAYTPEIIFDRFHKKAKRVTRENLNKISDIGNVPIEVFEEFIENYLSA